jgi:hypothetical protein
LLRDSLIAATGGQRPVHPSDHFPEFVIYFQHETKVDDPQPAVIHEQEIAGIHICIEHPAAIDHPVTGAQNLFGKFVADFLSRLCSEEFVEVQAGNPLHCQNAWGAVLAQHARHNNAVFWSEERPDLCKRRCLLVVIGLAFQAHPQIVKLLLRVFPISAQTRGEQTQKQILKVRADRAADDRIIASEAPSPKWSNAS